MSQLAAALFEELSAEERPPEDATELMLMYAVLCTTVGSGVTSAQVHDAWTAWMASRGRSHPSMVPYGELSPEVQLLDEPYAAAIRRVAVRRES